MANPPTAGAVPMFVTRIDTSVLKDCVVHVAFGIGISGSQGDIWTGMVVVIKETTRSGDGVGAISIAGPTGPRVFVFCIALMGETLSFWHAMASRQIATAGRNVLILMFIIDMV